jgi:hypothetical protein
MKTAGLCVFFAMYPGPDQPNNTMNFHHKLTVETTEKAPRCTHTTEFFEGLPEGVKHTDLLRLVQNLEKKIGLSSAAVLHLEYLVTHTREVDWQPGAAPIVYRSVQNTATDRRRTERQIHNLECSLHRAGLIQWNDTENYKRYGRRDHRGHIEYAYGVDLTPLGMMYDRLVELNEQHMAYMSSFAEIKHKVSGLRRRIINKIDLAKEYGLVVDEVIDELATLPRIAANMTIMALTNILNQAREINFTLDDILKDQQKPAPSVADETGTDLKQTSDPSELNFRHIQSTASQQSIYIECNQEVGHDSEKVGEKISTGMEHLTYDQVIDAASDEFVECIQPSATGNKYTDLNTAAARMCHRMGIGRFAWIKACSTMGDTAAAVAVLIIDRNRKHPIIPVVNPGGVLRGMTAKAKAGDLNLHRSLYAILSRDSAGGVQ